MTVSQFKNTNKSPHKYDEHMMKYVHVGQTKLHVSAEDPVSRDNLSPVCSHFFVNVSFSYLKQQLLVFCVIFSSVHL